ncbi:MAG: flavin reductase [Lachnospiraceae bacterium]|nr:flavin reductase [Lachnospiraceae bacterium]
MDKKAMYKLSYGLFIVTTEYDGKVNGCISNTAMQVTTDPNKIVIAVNKSNLTHDLMLASNKFNVSILSQDADFELFKHFGFQSGRDVDKFAGFTDCKLSGNGLPYITRGTNAWLSCWIDQTIDLGTHTLFIAFVTDMEVLSATPSCTYEYYQSEIKPKPQKVGTTPEGKTVWRCRICGYEYVGEELPADFICPLCKHPASDFEKVVV